MKKITYLFAAMVAAFGFSGCNETWDDNPTLITHEGDPVENFLNTPAEAKTAIMITDADKKGELRLTGSQPTQYGYAASVAYDLEMALNEDFTTPAAEGEGVPTSVILGQFKNLSNINPSLRSVAEGICKLLDIKDASKIPTDYMPVYMRLRANVVNESNAVIPGTSFTSNAVCYEKIAVGYLAVVIPGLSRQPHPIYLRGDVNDWLNPQLNEGVNTEILPTYEFLTTTEADTYELEYVEIPKGKGFKFADKGWSDPNISTDGVVGTFDAWVDCAWNAGNSTFSEDFKGSITIKGADQSWKVMFTKAEPDTPDKASGIYITGVNGDWGFTNDALQFYTTDVKNTWKTKGKVELPVGEFKVADSSWSNPNLGTNGKNVVPGAKYECVFGAGNMYLETAFSGTVTLRKKGTKWYLILNPE